MHQLSWAKKNISLCLYPYETVDIRYNDQTGDIIATCCCNLESPPIIGSDSKDIFLNIKKEMESGQLPKNCRKCINEEKNGGISERVRGILTKSAQELDDFLLTYKSTNYEIRTSASNLCSLSCRSCSPNNSSTYAKITNHELIFSSLDATKNIDYWNYFTNLVQQNVGKIDNLHIHLIGGEPLSQKSTIKILNWLVVNGFSKQLFLSFTTSLTPHISSEILELIKKFKAISFILSIDSISENYKYVRWPAKFDKVESNLELLLKYKRDGKITEVNVKLVSIK